MAKISIGTIQQNIVKETAIGEVEVALTALDEPARNFRNWRKRGQWALYF